MSNKAISPSLLQGLPDFLAGRVPLKFDTVVMSRGPALDGCARALAVTSAHRSAGLPQVPTVMESGVPELAQFEATGWFGLYGPAGLPAEILGRLNAAVLAVLRRPEIVAHLRNNGADLIGSTPQVFAEHNRREVERWGALIRRLGVAGRLTWRLLAVLNFAAALDREDLLSATDPARVPRAAARSGASASPARWP